MIPTAEHLDVLFRSGKMKRLGMGTRRACYAIPDTDLCVKCYRSEDEIALGKHVGHEPFKPLKDAVVREIRRNRFSDSGNTSCQEWRYYNKLKERLSAELAAAFPDMLERVLVPVRGWCIVENVIRNFDGSPIHKFHEALKDATLRGDAYRKGALTAALKCLEDELVRHAVKFYDPQNVMVQWTAGDAFRLRIVDFEPATRSFIPVDSVLPALVRCKVRRRFARYRDVFAQFFEMEGT